MCDCKINRQVLLCFALFMHDTFFHQSLNICFVCVQTGGQSDGKLQQTSHCLTDLIKIAAQTPGNYILDQVILLIHKNTLIIHIYLESFSFNAHSFT